MRPLHVGTGDGGTLSATPVRKVRVDPTEIEQVGVVGCGLMGSGIVEVVARSGARVTFVEGTSELVERGRAAVERSVGKAVERGKLEAADAAALLGRVEGATELAALADCALVIEAATERLEAKLEIFAALGSLTRPETILASNTSSIPIADWRSPVDGPIGSWGCTSSIRRR